MSCEGHYEVHKDIICVCRQRGGTGGNRQKEGRLGGAEGVEWRRGASDEDSLSTPKTGKEDRKDGGVVHLLKNQPPLARKVVEKIREGAFVEFATFPVFDDGPSETGGLKLDQGEPDESRSGGSASRKKNTMEIPDLSGWSTCFTLF